MFYVYQPHLTDDQINEVNAGLSDHDAYSRTMFMNDENAWHRIMLAVDYYSHAATVDVHDPDAVFQVTNIGPDHLIDRHGPMRSGSVGDVLIKADHTAGYVCLPFGWLELTRDQICEFQSLVTTVMKMGELIASA